MQFQRILLVVHHYPPRRVGGAELLTRRLAQWLARHGITVHVLCIESIARGTTTTVTPISDSDGDVQVTRLWVTVSPAEDVRLWYAHPLLHAQVASTIYAFQPDLLHLVSGYLFGAAPLDAARARSLPSVVTLTDFWFLCPTIQLLRGDGTLCLGPEPVECVRCLADDRRVFRSLDQRAPQLNRAFWQTAASRSWLGSPFGLSDRLSTLETRQNTLIPALNRSDAIISLTQFVADLHIRNGADPSKITVKPDCLDRDDFDAFTPSPLHQGEIHFGYFGQITPIKGVDVLLRAFQRAAATSPLPLHLHLYGNLNAERSYVDRLKRLAANSPNIVFHGTYEHRRALALMNALDAVVVPSLWYENSPRVILESFAAHRPVIGTHVGGIAEVVSDDKNGLLFERGSADDLARVLNRVISDPSLLPRLAQNIPSPRSLDEDMRDVLAVYERALRVSLAPFESAV